MNRGTSDPNTGAASADAGRRHFLMQPGAGVSASEGRGCLSHLRQKRPGVAFLRKDGITHHILQSPHTLRESETI
jgi:hypothetical protein